MEERNKRREKGSHENGRASLSGQTNSEDWNEKWGELDIEERRAAKRKRDLGLAEDRGKIVGMMVHILQETLAVATANHSQITLPSSCC